MYARRHGRFRRAIPRVAPFASFAGLSVLTAAVKRRAVIRRVRGLEEEVEKIGEGSTLRASLFEAALESRSGELATYDEIPQAIGLINAQPEGIERRAIAERRGNSPPSSLGNTLLIRQPRVLELVKNDAFASCTHSGAPTTLHVSSSGGDVAVRTYPRNLKSLALLAVLVLCLFAFTLVSTGEAQAEERLSQTPQQSLANGEAERSEIPKGQGSDRAAVQTSLVGMESVGSTMTDASPPGQSLSSPVGSTPPASKPEPAPQQHAVVISNGEVVETDPDLASAPQKAQSAPASELSDQPSPGKQAEAEPKKPTPTRGSAAQEPYSGSSEMEVPAAPVSGDVRPPVPSVSEGEGVPTGSPAPSPLEEDPDAGIAPPSPGVLIEPVEQQETPSAADLVASPAPSRTPGQVTPPSAQEGAQQPLPVSSAVEAASGGAVQATLTQTLTTVADAAASVLETLGSWTHYSPSGETTESPSQGATPEPLAPHLPSPFEGSSVFSSYSGLSGQTGPWGGFVVLLLGVLVSGLVLLLREGFLCWAACEQPKPSSALLAPLERPG